MAPFDILSNDSIRDIAISLSLREIKDFCLTNTRFNRIIGRDEGFWHRKFVHDFDFNPSDYRGSWRQLYQNYTNVWVCGANNWGQLGLGQIQRVKQVNVLTRIQNIKAQQVACGMFDTIIIDLENNVWACGENKSGQLGLGDTEIRNAPTQIPNIKALQVSAGYRHTVIIDMENNVWVCGNNDYGQLGLGDTENRNAPTQIPNINLLGNLLVKDQQVAAGFEHTVLIDMENNVWICGNNSSGQLGLGDTQPRYFPTQMPNIKARQIVAGYYHTIMIDLDYNVWVWGQNKFGQLGINQAQTLVPTRIENINLLGNLLFKAQQVSSLANHTVIIDLNHNVWVSGENNCAQLGLGDNQNRSIFTQIPNIKAHQVSVGLGYTVIIGMKI